MLIPCHKLKHALDLIEPAVSRKTTLPITQNFLMQRGQVMATNLDIAISASLPEVKGAAICLPYAMVNRFLQHIPDTTVLDITVDRGRQTTIKADRMTTTIHGAVPKDFPPFPDTGTHKEESVDGDRLINALMGVVPATAREDSRPVLTGVCLTFGDPIEVAAADGYRIVWNHVAIKLESLNEDARQIVIPREAVLALDKTWKRAVKAPAVSNGQAFLNLTGGQPSMEAATMAIARRMAKMRHSVEKNLLSLNLGEVMFTTLLLQGTFPDYHTLIQEDFSRQVTFDAAEAYRAIRMLSGIAPATRPTNAARETGTIRVRWEEDLIEFSAITEDIGDIAQSMPATIRGEAGRIAFNTFHLMEYLSSKEGLILMETSSQSSSARFTHARSPNVVIMPKFIKWGDEPEVAPPAEVEVAEDESPAIEETGAPIVDATEPPAPEPRQ